MCMGSGYVGVVFSTLQEFCNANPVISVERTVDRLIKPYNRVQNG